LRRPGHHPLFRPLQLLDPLGENVKRMLRRDDQAHEQVVITLGCASRI
jgi:hypothetical protein